MFVVLSLVLVSSVLGQDLFFCNFENNEDQWCGIQQDGLYDSQDTYSPPAPAGSYNWTRKSGATATAGTGPDGGYKSTYYVYLESSDPHKHNDFARISTRPLGYTGPVCVQFFYHMSGPDVGKLEVTRVDGNEAGSMDFMRIATFWSRSGDQGNIWKEDRVDTTLSNSLTGIGFTGIRGQDYRGDIAIDDVRVTRGTCSGVTVTPSPGVGVGPIVNLPLSCSFESESICNFYQSQVDTPGFDWSRLSGTTVTETTGPNVAQSGSYYMYIETSEPRVLGDRAILETPRINFAGSVCLDFYYHMWGANIGTLGVGSTSRGEGQLWTLIERPTQAQQEWKRARVDIQLNTNDRISFIGNRGNGIYGDIAIDNVQVIAGRCDGVFFPPSVSPGIPTMTNLPFTCTFESADICGMTQRTNDNFDWTRLSGPTQSEGTGPDSAQEGSWYIYTEASQPRLQGDKAYLETPSIIYNGLVCVSFYRHIYDSTGANMGELKVFGSFTGEGQPFYTSESSRPFTEKAWKLERISVNIRNQERIVFLGIRGKDIQGDIAIDRLQITVGSCTTSPTASPPTGGEGTVLNMYNCAAEGDGTTSSNCRMRQDFSDGMQWSMRSGRTPSGVDDRRINGNRYPITGPEGAATGSNYIYLEASGKPAGTMGRLIMEGSDFSRGGDNCLRFRYSMNGFHVGELRVYVIQNGQKMVKWMLEGDQLQGWKSAAVELNMNGVSQVGFEGTTKGAFSGDISLDDIQMTSGKCEATPSQYIWQCNFETGTGAATFCNMDQDTTDSTGFDWKMWTGMTPSIFTGPERAFNGAYYIFIESSVPRRPGDQARLFTPTMTQGGTVCVQFYRHMYGFHIGELTVHYRRNNQISAAIWTLVGEQGNQWQESSVTVEALQLNDQIVFRGVVGNEYSGDIALDNIRIRSGSCSNFG